MKTTSLVALLPLALYHASSTYGQTLEWVRQLGTVGDDKGTSISADGLGNVYTSGETTGELEVSSGHRDAFLSKYNAGGTLEWTRQLGTDDVDRSRGVSTDGLGNVYIAGDTWGSLQGANAGRVDAFVSKYNTEGTLEWTRQFGTSGSDRSNETDGLGHVYVSGFTEGSLDGANAGDHDSFVAKFSGGLPTPVADLDGDGEIDGDDVDSLVREIVADTNDSAFDLSADGTVDNDDLGQWLSEAATANGFDAPYLLGDANLDGTVNAADLNDLGQNWLGHPNTWQAGDFTADGVVDAGDLNQLGQNWLMAIPSAASVASVPEPKFGLLLLVIMATRCLLGRADREVMDKRGDDKRDVELWALRNPA